MFSGGNQSHPDPPEAAPSLLRPSHSAPSSLGGQAYRYQDSTKIILKLKKIQGCFLNTHHFDRNKLSVHGTGVLVVVVKISKVR